MLLTQWLFIISVVTTTGWLLGLREHVLFLHVTLVVLNNMGFHGFIGSYLSGIHGNEIIKRSPLDAILLLLWLL